MKLQLQKIITPPKKLNNVSTSGQYCQIFLAVLNVKCYIFVI